MVEGASYVRWSGSRQQMTLSLDAVRDGVECLFVIQGGQQGGLAARRGLP